MSSDPGPEYGDRPIDYWPTETGWAADLTEDEAEAEWAAEWDDADSAAYQARVEASLESEAGS